MKSYLSLFILLLCVTAFMLGLVHLIKVRFDLGDVYPQYSSLRADPLGTMALCESLERIPGLSVERDFRADNQMPYGKQTTYLHLGARTLDWRWLDEDVFKDIEGFVTSGGRLAITFFPELRKPFEMFPDSEQTNSVKSEKKSESKTPKKSKRAEEEQKRLLRRFSVEKRWGLEFGYLPLRQNANGSVEAEQVESPADLSLPKTLEWHTSTIFTNLPDSWHVIYSRGTNPVVIERKFGRGSIAMATDSFFVSNEALWKEPQTQLLSWWIGPARHVVFDEAHFGIIESQGVAALLRKYRLQELVAGLILLAGLFIWKNSFSLVPPERSAAQNNYISGKETSAGFVNLLRRNIPERDLLDICFAEWKKSRARDGRYVAERQARAEAVLQADKSKLPRQRSPLSAYREICRLLKKL